MLLNITYVLFHHNLFLDVCFIPGTTGFRMNWNHEPYETFLFVGSYNDSPLALLRHGFTRRGEPARIS